VRHLRTGGVSYSSCINSRPPAASPLHEVSPQHASLHVSDSCSPVNTATGAAQQASPRQDSTPSRIAKTAMTSAAMESAQAHPNSELSSSPAKIGRASCRERGDDASDGAA